MRRMSGDLRSRISSPLGHDRDLLSGFAGGRPCRRILRSGISHLSSSQGNLFTTKVIIKQDLFWFIHRPHSATFSPFRFFNVHSL